MRESILLVSNKFDPHVDRVILELDRRGAKYFRLNTEDFPQKLTIEFRGDESYFGGLISSHHGTLSISEIKSIWYRRPLVPEIDSIIQETERELSSDLAQEVLDSIYYTVQAFWVSFPLYIRRANNKLLQLQLARSLGLKIPLTLVTTNPREAEKFFSLCQQNGRSMVIKLLRIPKRMYRGKLPPILTAIVDNKHIEYIDWVKFAPCLFQEYIPKSFELRITVIGRKIFAVAIHSQEKGETRIDWRSMNINNPPFHTPYTLPEYVEAACLSLVENLGLAFGAIDMIITPEGEYIFLEINPNGQWMWIEDLTGLSMTMAMVELLINGEA